MPAAVGQIDRAGLIEQFHSVRRATESACRPLSPEDCNLQSMPDASPTKWHLAHTTWFFETFVLSRSTDYRWFDPEFNYLFNSYYEAVGPRHPRPMRGMLSRPSIDAVYRYRSAIDDRMDDFLKTISDVDLAGIAPVFTLGLHHEQQHQELILTDILHAFSSNPLKPAYDSARRRESSEASAEHSRNSHRTEASRWLEFESGVRWIGHAGDGFAFDNESPRHRVWAEAFRINSRLVTNGEYIEFINERGYERPELWLSDGWAVRQARQWTAPLYWSCDADGWQQFTLGGLTDIEVNSPVRHVSFYEADAFARWAGARLPTETEWEIAAGVCGSDLVHAFGRVWQWTASPYIAYPGYRPASGALGEYNGKFMCNQMVLRGGSLATPTGHSRITYRNFFPPDARWQFAGLRLASDR